MNYKSDEELNTLGLICPLPIIETSKFIKNIEVGKILAVRSDDGAILIDMPAWCNSNGHEYLGHEEIEEIKAYVVYVRKRNRIKN